MRTGRPRPPRRRAARALAAGLVVVGLAAPLAGCDLRAQTAPPVAPSPDAVELVRGGEVARSLALAQDAQSALATPAGSAKAVAAVLDDVAAFSQRHADELGGTYRSGLASDATPLATTTASSPATPAEVLASLVDARTTALGNAGGAADGGLARLLASIGTSRGELATRLAAATGTKVPKPSAAATSSAGAAAASTPAPVATPSGSPFTDADAQALVRAHDQAGYGFEVVAAKLSGAERKRAVAAAVRHRTAAAALATEAGIADTPDDPRRAAYTLPVGLSDPKVVRALARSLETSLADAYATAVAHTPAGQRADAIAGLRTATADARAWGAAAVAFPGMPELAQQPTG